ncbi:MAG: orotidine-5'-phosphate decarboxylase [Candidatus Nitrosotenuis sp.]
MSSFKERIRKISSEKSPLILANDYEDPKNLELKTINNIKSFARYLCAVKLNFHLLLPLGEKQISKINKIAHDHGLQTIADIKLNDIGNTNLITTKRLWSSGFDAVIVNPMMGPQGLRSLVNYAHKNKKGVISLCHMSSPEAKITYELKLATKKSLYQLFLEWAIKMDSDGIIVGATFPKIIQYCEQKSKGKLDIYSPGIGTQGGDVQKTLAAGSDYLIVGRSILNSKDPVLAAKTLCELTGKD